VSGVDTLTDTETEFRKYDRYPDPMRMKLVIAGLPSSIQWFDLQAFNTKRLIGFDQLNGTFFWPVLRSNYHCMVGPPDTLDSLEVLDGGSDFFTAAVLEQQESYDGGTTWEAQGVVDAFDECRLMVHLSAFREIPHFRAFTLGFTFVYMDNVMPGNTFTVRIAEAGRSLKEEERTTGGLGSSVYQFATMDSKRFPSQSGNLAWVRELWLQNASGVAFDSDLNAAGSDYSAVWDGSAYKTAGTWAVTLEPVP
jgi:hypothetical protein